MSSSSKASENPVHRAEQCGCDRREHADPDGVEPALRDKRVSSFRLLGVRTELGVESELLARRAERREEDPCEGKEEENAVAPCGRSDRRFLQADAEAIVLVVPERLLDREPPRVQLDDLVRGEVGSARGEEPRLLHVLLLHADDARHGEAGMGHERVLDLPRAPVLEDPLARRSRAGLLGPDHDATAKADHEVPAEGLVEELVELRVAERAITEDRDLHAFGHHRRREAKQIVLVLVAMVLQSLLAYGAPHERRRPPVVRDHREGKRRLAVGVEVRPVEGSVDLRAFADDPGHIGRHGSERRVESKRLIAQQAVHLLDPVLRALPSRTGQRPSDLRYAHPPGVEDTQGAERERQDPLLVQDVAEDRHERGEDEVAVEEVAHGLVVSGRTDTDGDDAGPRIAEVIAPMALRLEESKGITQRLILRTCNSLQPTSYLTLQSLTLTLKVGWNVGVL